MNITSDSIVTKVTTVSRSKYNYVTLYITKHEKTFSR